MNKSTHVNVSGFLLFLFSLCFAHHKSIIRWELLLWGVFLTFGSIPIQELRNPKSWNWAQDISIAMCKVAIHWILIRSEKDLYKVECKFACSTRLSLQNSHTERQSGKAIEY